MAISSQRSLSITLSGGITYSQQFSAGTNATSPGIVEMRDLAVGFQSITVPTAGSSSAKAVTIIPPSGNTQTITLKGVTGDTGVPIHKTDPTTIGLDGNTTIGITTGGTISGVQFIWT